MRAPSPSLDPERFLAALAGGSAPHVTPRRRALLAHALSARQGFTISELAIAVGMTRQAVYVAIEGLRNAGLLAIERVGRWYNTRLYYASPGPNLQVLASAFHNPWPAPMPRAQPRARTPAGRRSSSRDPIPPRGRVLLAELRRRGLESFRTAEAQEAAEGLGYRAPIRTLLGFLVGQGRIRRISYGVYVMLSTSGPGVPQPSA